MVIKINKRELLLFTASIAGIVAAGSVSYSFLQQMSPDLTAYSDSVVDINLSNIAVGKAIFVKWRGSIVVIKNRTPEEIAYAKNIPLSKLKDKFARNPNLPENTPATDLARSGGVEHENFLIYINHCTHLGCPMLDQMDSKNRIYCPCHGSVYDTAGRVLSGPAPENLHIPPYKFISNNILRIG